MASFVAVLVAVLAVSANDNKVILIDGKLSVQQNAAPDTVSVIDLSRGVPKVIAEVEAPTMVFGPPMSVAIAPDQRLAMVSAGMQVSVIDLSATPVRVVGTVHTGAGASGVSIAPNGTLALVANRSAGTVSVLRIEGTEVEVIDTVKVGTRESGPGAIAITPDGRNALVTRDGDSTISVLSIDGETVRDIAQDFGAGLKPYGLAISRKGDLAIVANVSLGRGDNDTIGVIDLRTKPFRTVDTLSVGQTPEGIALSPDGRWCAIVLLNGSNKPTASPFYHANGTVVLFSIESLKLTRVSDVPVGAWPQGAAFAGDSSTLLVQSMTERNIRVLKVGARGELSDTGTRLPLSGGGAALMSSAGPHR